MIRIGVISNLASSRNQAGMSAVRAVLARHRNLVHAEIEAVADIGEVLTEFGRREVDLLVVNSGDGTVQKVLTELLNGSAFQTTPELSILPAGMTNQLALDACSGEPPARSLRRIVEGAAAGAPPIRCTRNVLSMSYDPRRPPVHGMFLGTAAFHRWVMATRRAIYSRGARRSLAIGLTIGMLVMKWLKSGNGSEPLFAADSIEVEADGVVAGDSEHVLFLATTLRRMPMGLNPFWGGDGRAIRYTRIGGSPLHPTRAVLPVLRGRPRPWMATGGYISGTADRLKLRLRCPVLLDGETFHPDPDVPLQLSAEHKVVFVRW